MSDGCCYRVERPSVVVLTVLLPAKYLYSSLDLLVTKGHEQKEITALPEYYLTMNTTSEQEGRGCARDMPPVSAAKPANAPARPAEAAVRAEAVCGRLVRLGAPGGARLAWFSLSLSLPLSLSLSLSLPSQASVSLSRT